MHMITRCPSCTTVYLLEDTHIKTANGWLRCGACGHVFDSTGLVLRWTSVSAEPTVLQKEPDAALPEPASRCDLEVLPLPDLVVHTEDRIALKDLLNSKDLGTPVKERQAQAELASFEQALSSFKSEPVAGETKTKPENASLSRPLRDSFTRYGVLISAFLVLLQMSYVKRDAIAATWPGSEPVIRSICQFMGCLVNPMIDVEGVVIDSSNLVQFTDEHVLTWSVRNTTTRSLGMTALELSLMDAQGKLVLRTVILPEQAGAPNLLKPGQSWSGSLKVFVSPELRFTDYRLLSFYP